MHAFRPRIAGPEVSVTDLLLFVLTRNIYGAERLYYRAAICWKDGLVLYQCFWFGNSFIVKTSRDDYAKLSDRQNGVLCTFVYLALEINFPFLLWLSYLKCCKGFISCIVYRVSNVACLPWRRPRWYWFSGFHRHHRRSYPQSCESLFEDRLCSLVELLPFAEPANRLPTISCHHAIYNIEDFIAFDSSTSAYLNMCTHDITHNKC